jgi:hypothetical protein
MTYRNLLAAVLAAIAICGLAVSCSAPAPEDNVRVTGTVVLEKLMGGEVVDAESVEKTLTAPGIRHMIACFIGDSSSHFDTAAFIAVGNDSTATDTSMTTLQGDTITWGNVDSITKAANWVRWWRTFTTAQANHSWRETGLFNDSAKIMLDRGSYPAFGTKTTADTWRIYVEVGFD